MMGTWNLRLLQVLIAQIHARSVHTSDSTSERFGRGLYDSAHDSLAVLTSIIISLIYIYICLHRKFFVLQCITQLTLLELEEEEEEAAAPISFSGKPGNGKWVFVNRYFQLLPHQPSSDKCL